MELEQKGIVGKNAETANRRGNGNDGERDDKKGSGYSSKRVL